MENLKDTGSWLHQIIKNDLNGEMNKIVTRFPPEPNGYLHIGHAKAICINFGMAKLYGGKCNLRFDDTNPAKEDTEYVEAIKKDIKWLGFEWDGLYFASDYFDKMYEFAVSLIKKGKAFVCDLTSEEVRKTRGTLNEAGKESPFRNRSIEENLSLFEKMKNGEFEDGARTLRAKIDVTSPNMNMRDPVIYRIAHLIHHNTQDKWCIYPMYDYAHPIEDAIEGITSSLCSLEFEDHRPLYDWYLREIGGFNPVPRQSEFSKLILTNTIMGKRYMRNLVEQGVVDGWDDPRLATLSGIRRRGYTPEAIRKFCDNVGVSKANSVVDIAFLEHCVREDLLPKSKSIMTVLDPVKVVITNYDENKEEWLSVENNTESEEMGTREVPFSRELYIEREDFMEEAPKKYHRLAIGQEVRLKGAYFILCNEVVKDEAGNIIEIHCTYDEKTKSGSGFSERKVKGTIHWVSAKHAVNVRVNLLSYLVFDDAESESGYRENPESIVVLDGAFAEPSVKNAKVEDRFQFLRNGYFCLDYKTTSCEKMVFNRIVSLKSSYAGKKTE